MCYNIHAPIRVSYIECRISVWQFPLSMSEARTSHLTARNEQELHHLNKEEADVDDVLIASIELHVYMHYTKVNSWKASVFMYPAFVCACILYTICLPSCNGVGIILYTSLTIVITVRNMMKCFLLMQELQLTMLMQLTLRARLLAISHTIE